MLRDPKKKTDAEILGAAETEETQEGERERDSESGVGGPSSHSSRGSGSKEHAGRS